MQRFSALLVRISIVFGILGLGSTGVLPARADATGEKRKAQLAKVQRVAVLPSLWGTETLRKFDDQKAHPESAQPDAKLTEYAEHLRALETHAREWLPQRLKARTDFQLVPPEEVEAALKELKLTPEALFQNGGRMKGKSFAEPDAAAVRTLAQKLHADAILLSTLDEPRRSNGGLLFDPFVGLAYDAPKVSLKIAFRMLLPDATEIFHSYIEVLHPMTKLGARTFLRADWLETEDQVIENFMDELTRYTPLKTSEKRQAG